MKMDSWNDGMSVGVRKVDDQHKRMVVMINELHMAMRGGKGRKELEHLFKELADYTVTHFRTEEELMLTYGYPVGDYEFHKQEHDKLTEQVKELRSKAEEGKLAITIEVMNFLRDWLVNHILDTDKKMGPFFAAKGLK